jgi:D-alanine-D-alanine ligase
MQHGKGINQMKIALTYNLNISNTEEEAEFDSQETIDALTQDIIKLGHTVEHFNVSQPVYLTVAGLEAYQPDLIFNTAEGKRGRCRESFYPALFAELGFPYSGSDAYTLAVTLDKHLTKLLLQQHHIPMPNWQFIQNIADLDLDKLRLPLIIKPNFEGSSKGITQESIVETLADAKIKVTEILNHYPTGVLVEEYIRGKDITVPFLAGVDNKYNGILGTVEYIITPIVNLQRKYFIYDYDLKGKYSNHVDVRVPANIPEEISQEICHLAEKIFQILDCRDLGRIDFRLSDDGIPYFLEINALPSLEPGAGIYAAAKLVGLDFTGVINSIIESAIQRYVH